MPFLLQNEHSYLSSAQVYILTEKLMDKRENMESDDSLTHLAFVGKDGETNYQVESLNKDKGSYVITREEWLVKWRLELVGGSYVLHAEDESNFPADAISKIINHLNSLVPTKTDKETEDRADDVKKAIE